MELETVHKVALYGFLGAVLFGAVANKTHFCTMGSISDWINIGTKNRFRTWMLAMGIAMVGTQIMAALGWVDLSGSVYLNTTLGWAGNLFGGFVFGVGMTIGSGCGQRSLVRVGNGNLKSLVVVLVLGITAYATLRGILAPTRLQLAELTSVDLQALGPLDQSIPTLLAAWLGADAQTIALIVTGVVALAVGIFAFSEPSYRRDFDNILAALTVGLLVVGGWYLTGVIGNDEFEPVPVESLTFIAPIGNTINYLMTYTGATINFGIAVMLGVILGSLIYGVASGTFRIETFASRADLVNHILAGVLMGFGGVLAVGCTIGQGVTGMSTLALGSLIALMAIIAGCAFTIKMQYYMLDEGFGSALRSTLTDFKLMPRKSAYPADEYRREESP